MEEAGFSRCKKLMIFFNILFLLGGAAMLGVGAWVIVDFASFSATLGAGSLLYQYAAYIAVVVGGCTVLMSLCGCVGAWKESRCLLTMFTIVLVFFLFVEIAALVLIFVFSNDVERILSEAALNSIKSQYGTSSATGQSVTVAWDFTHASLGCCGFNNGRDYFQSLYDISNTNAIQPWPPSCCVLNSSGGYIDSNQCLNSTATSATNSHALTGCYGQLRNLVTMYSTVVGAVIGGIMAVQLIALIFACCVSSHIGKSATVHVWE